MTNNYSKKSDVWYFGLLIYEISQLKPINKFYYNNIDNIYNYIIKGKYTINSYYSKDIKELIKLCLQYSPSRRPSFEQILRLIDLYRKNKTLNEKMKICKNNNRKGKFFRKINLKSEIDKFNKTLNKLKNYETNGNKKNRNQLTRTPTYTRKDNFNININNKTFNKKNLTKHNSKENILKNKFQFKKCVIDNENKIFFNISGKKLFPIKNQQKNNSTFVKINRNRTHKKFQRPIAKIPLIINITDNNKKEINKSAHKITRTYISKDFGGSTKNPKNNSKVALYNIKRKDLYFKDKMKRQKLSNSFCISKLRIKNKL